MKYTIELTNKQKAQMDCMIDIVHRYVGFNPKLEPIKTTNVEDTTYDVAYNKGLEDAEMANRYFYDTDKSLLSISEKVRLWKEEKKKAEEEIRVGDEVFITGLKDQETIGVITMLANNNYTVICLINGSEMARVTKNDIKPTGRHFAEISQLFNKLRGEE